MKTVKKIIIFCIQTVSKWFKLNNLRACRFYPSCSEYSVEAFQKFDLLRASWLAATRLCRCHPFTAGGVDLLPQPEVAKIKG